MIIIVTITFSNNYIITITFLRLNIFNDYILRNLTYLSVDFNQALIIKNNIYKNEKDRISLWLCLTSSHQHLSPENDRQDGGTVPSGAKA